MAKASLKKRSTRSKSNTAKTTFNPFAMAPLITVAHGREYAVAFLRHIDNLGQGADEYSATKGPDGAYRKGPQSPLVRNVFDVVHTSVEAAKAGFFQVITESIGFSSQGWIGPGEFEKEFPEMDDPLRGPEKRQPHDPLMSSELENLYSLIRRALAVALLMMEAPHDDHDEYVAGSIVDSLHRARRIMELGSEHAALAEAAR